MAHTGVNPPVRMEVPGLDAFLRLEMEDANWAHHFNPPSVNATSPTGGYPEFESNPSPISDNATKNTMRLQIIIFGRLEDTWAHIALPQGADRDAIDKAMEFHRKESSRFLQATPNNRLAAFVQAGVAYHDYLQHRNNLGVV